MILWNYAWKYIRPFETSKFIDFSVKKALEQGAVMKYPQIQGLEDEKFCQLTGVKCSTFEKMISILKETDVKKKNQVVERVNLYSREIFKHEMN